MTVIDRYIGKKFFITFFSILFAFILVFSLIHWVDHSSKYSKADIETILRFYINYVPQIINLVIPVCGLLTGLITFSNLGKYNELVALQVSGVSRRRYIMPALVICFIISTSLFFFNEYVLIDSNKKRVQIEKVEILKRKMPSKGVKTNVIFYLDETTIANIGRIDIDEQKLERTSIQYFEPDMKTITKRIDIANGTWTDSTEWSFIDVFVRTFDDDRIVVQSHDTLQFSDNSFKPIDFAEPRFRADRVDRFLTLNELINFANKRKAFGQTTERVDYEIYNCFFGPLSVFFMAFIGSILGSMIRKGSVIIYFLLCVIICLIYMVIVIMGKVFAQDNTIPAFLGASLPHLVTLLILSYLVNKKA